MSTRCNIILEDEYTKQEKNTKLWFYRHSDGYPDGALPLLVEFMQYVINGSIRDNVSQAGGWLIMLGAEEYGLKTKPNKQDGFSGWKVGSIEPTTNNHWDVDYIYNLDLQLKTISYQDYDEENDRKINVVMEKEDIINYKNK